MLREEQIQRYSRHILLRGVGGVGQARLLSARVEIVGGGPASAFAAAYLAASGTQVSWRGGVVTSAERGLLFEGIDSGRQRSEAGAARVAELNPDATPQARPSQLLELWEGVAALLEGGGPRILLGEQDGSAAVILAPAGSCGHCLRGVWRPGSSPPRQAEVAGGFAALLVQRQVLTPESRLRVWTLDEAGALSERELAPCDHRSA